MILLIALAALFIFRHAAGPALFHWAFYGRNRFLDRKIQPAPVSERQLAEEKKWTRLSAIAEPMILAIFYGLYVTGHTRLYWNFAERGALYAVLSFVALFYAQDLYFYLMHRALHWGPLYRRLHAIHHRSKNPSPWAAFAMHPAEKFGELLFFPLIAIVVPLNPLALVAFVFVSSLLNLWGHTGIELNPFRVSNHGITKCHSSSTFHNQHHELNRWNFGLYFSHWDKLLGTEHESYQETFARNAKRCPTPFVTR